MKLLFVRHGQSTANLEGVFSNRGWKHPLTRTGFHQANRLAVRLADLKVERIYTSPIQRAVQTARVLAEALSAPLEVTAALREWDVGIYEGTADPQGWVLHRKVQQQWFQEGRFDQCMPGGESYRDIERRFQPFLDRLVTAGGSTDRKVLLVAHGGLYLAMLPACFQNVDFAFAQAQGFPYTGLVQAEVRPDGLYCLTWCGVEVSD